MSTDELMGKAERAVASARLLLDQSTPKVGLARLCFL